jgi:hypothetical protein
MLDARVVQAVADGHFHIYTANLASQGMELLTGVPFGTLAPHDYAADTVLGMAQRTLQAYRQACESPRETSGRRRLHKTLIDSKKH